MCINKIKKTSPLNPALSWYPSLLVWLFFCELVNDLGVVSTKDWPIVWGQSQEVAKDLRELLTDGWATFGHLQTGDGPTGDSLTHKPNQTIYCRGKIHTKLSLPIIINSENKMKKEMIRLL